MKKILLITAISLLLSSNVYAEKEHAHKKHGMSDDLFKEMDLDNNKFISEIELMKLTKSTAMIIMVVTMSMAPKRNYLKKWI